MDDNTFNELKNKMSERGFTAYHVANGEAAKDKVAELIPEGSSVMQMTSVTLDSTGISEMINNSGKYDASKPKMYSENVSVEEKKKLGYVVDYTIGSVHAVTNEGELLIASNTGSQLGAYLYGADKVIFVIGSQKIVDNLDAGIKRIYEYVLPLESERAKKAYGSSGSNVSKLVIFNKEVLPDRVHIILVDEELGY